MIPIKDPKDVVVLIPIYKRELESLERFSIDYSLSVLTARRLIFVAPEGLDTSFYENRYPSSNIERFEPSFFKSVEDYSRLMLSSHFYERFAGYEFALILQTDAIVFKDELDYWCAQVFDFVGAPWPSGCEFTINLDRFSGSLARRVKVTVGNGGLSLRRIKKCLQLIKEFPTANAVFAHTGSNEDYFFAFMGSLSEDFIIPNEITASRFSMELDPEYYYAVNGKKYPMGAHAWWSVNPSFWAPCAAPLAAVLAPTHVPS